MALGWRTAAATQTGKRWMRMIACAYRPTTLTTRCAVSGSVRKKSKATIMALRTKDCGHFALLPRLIKENAPYCRVAIFWHIPWPNPEAFGICPWQRELLEGLLGADLIGFHIQSHCNNFLETVDRALESRIDWERFAVNRRKHLTLVRPFPISVDFHESPEGTSAPASTHSIYLERSALFRELGVQAAFMGVGVDRVDYTKG